MGRITYDHSTSNIDGLISDITKHGIEYSVDEDVRDAKSNTKHSPVPKHETPQVVFLPRSTQETAIVLKACNDRRVAATSFSGGTSFGGALTSVRGGVCVSFERMKKIVALHEDDQDVVVQPGLGWMDLNEQLKEKGLFFPVDPAPGACGEAGAEVGGHGYGGAWRRDEVAGRVGGGGWDERDPGYEGVEAGVGSKRGAESRQGV
ncbi:D-lactate ferricytochrome c oxidoreductase [Coniothyrium glycines]